MSWPAALILVSFLGLCTFLLVLRRVADLADTALKRNATTHAEIAVERSGVRCRLSIEPPAGSTSGSRLRGSSSPDSARNGHTVDATRSDPRE